MAAPLHPSVGVSIGLLAFVAWRLATRMRRVIGRQRLSRWRPWFTAVFFPLLVLLLLLAALARPEAAIALLGGCAVGVGLGFWGLRLTRFEATPQGLFYTPNPYLGVALAVLLIARLGWRYVQLFGTDVPLAASPADYGRSPLTLLIFGMLAGYYATYAAGQLRWKLKAEAGPPPSAAT
jgi:cytochrome b561